MLVFNLVAVCIVKCDPCAVRLAKRLTWSALLDSMTKKILILVKAEAKGVIF
ncbi:hypothetical protein DSUL_140039 [Desulfovibrionales bacterium]